MTAVARRAPVVHLLRRQLRTVLLLAAWFWAIALVAVVVVSTSILRVNGSVDVSVVAFTRQAATWFPFSQAILTVALARVQLASGLTRRTSVRASATTAVLTGLLYTLVTVALLAAERQVHTAAGWGFDVAGRVLPDGGEGVLTLLVEIGPGLVLANLAGLLVGAVYQRGGSWWGTLTLPLTVAPVLLTVGIGSGWFGPLPVGPLAATPTGYLLGAAVAVVGTTAAYVLVARSAPVRAPR